MKKILNSFLILSFLAVNSGYMLSFAQTANAKNKLPPGSLIKARGNSAVYYVSSDGSRYVFPNDRIYNTWYTDFSNVTEVDMTDLSQYSIGGNVTYRPGVYMVKIPSDPKVYAVGSNGTLRWIKTENLAKKLYGDHWNLLIDDISAAYLFSYQLGDPIDDDSDF